MSGTERIVMRFHFPLPHRKDIPALLAASLALALPAVSSADAPTPVSPVRDAGKSYRVDPNWPRLPDGWLIGDVGGVSVDRHDHIWVFHRPGTLLAFDAHADAIPAGMKCCVAAPPVLEFDAAGNLLRAWGGAKQVSNWFDSEHGIFVDDEDHVWLVGAGDHDGQLLKLSADGKLLLRIGRKGEFVAADDPTMLGKPTDVYVDTKRREAFVSDGYRNHRVIVFDADTGAFKRQWTVFGKKVDPAYFTARDQDSARAQDGPVDQFTTVHCVTMIGDEVYVCDRTNDRIQVFKPDGTYVRELFYNHHMAGAGGGTWDAAPMPGHPDRLLVVDGANSEFAVLNARTGAVITSYLSKGRYAGQMHWPHQGAVDQQGAIYIAEVQTAARIQRFLPFAAAARVRRNRR
ncbi:hypothetical protein [Sphingobium nicotianae]|uniref:NHL repeat protein n=1 Tax=Sphingobium nicotianae TaxID=2782607 RepID=A0A9X1DAP2_9SPHN|nr:hypothetical protein [Sphingobium nicotianae]MBT2186542.1 hypothetical protein [Sphingobium nicotianae]